MSLHQSPQCTQTIWFVCDVIVLSKEILRNFIYHLHKRTTNESHLSWGNVETDDVLSRVMLCFFSSFFVYTTLQHSTNEQKYNHS